VPPDAGREAADADADADADAADADAARAAAAADAADGCSFVSEGSSGLWLVGEPNER
jgi:hypothetical protein